MSIRVDTMAETRELRRQAKEQKMKASTLGLAQGYQPHILDAIELGRTAWDGVSKEVIARCVLYAVVVGISLSLCPGSQHSARVDCRMKLGSWHVRIAC